MLSTCSTQCLHREFSWSEIVWLWMLLSLTHLRLIQNIAVSFQVWRSDLSPLLCRRTTAVMSLKLAWTLRSTPFSAGSDELSPLHPAPYITVPVRCIRQISFTIQCVDVRVHNICIVIIVLFTGILYTIIFSLFIYKLQQHLLSSVCGLHKPQLLKLEVTRPTHKLIYPRKCVCELLHGSIL